MIGRTVAAWFMAAGLTGSAAWAQAPTPTVEVQDAEAVASREGADSDAAEASDTGLVAMARDPVLGALAERWRTLRRQARSLAELEAAFRSAENVNRDLAFARWYRAGRAWTEELNALVPALLSAPDTPAARALTGRVRTFLEMALGRVDELAAATAEQLDAALANRETVPAEARLELEDRIRRTRERVAMHDQLTLDFLSTAQSLGLDISGALGTLRQRVADRADDLMTRMNLAEAALTNARERQAESPESAEANASVTLARRRLDGAVTAMRDSILILRQLGMPVADFEREVFLATGEITGDVLDQAVVRSLLDEWWGDAVAAIRTSGPTWTIRLIVVGLILLLTRITSSVVRRLVGRALTASRMQVSNLAREMIQNLSGRLVVLIGVLVSLGQVGIDLGPVLAGLGVAGFVVGFALQDTLSNFAAGAMILLYRPFDVDDVVEVAGSVFGVVSHMTLVSTTVITWDNQVLIVPNSRIWGDVIKNVTSQKTRRVDMSIGVAYSSDVDEVARVLRDIVTNHPLVLDDPEPMIRVHAFGDSAIEMIVRPWCRTDDYWTVFWDVQRLIKVRFDEEGIQIPFPQRDIHHHGLVAPPGAPRDS